MLPSKVLKISLDAIIEPDESGFIARLTDLPLYGYGEDPKEAIDMLKREIESLYEDLMEDDEFSEEWLRIKKFLAEKIIG
jgi:predicted RNase H-like HicB family nuclease